jgi:regulator of cell morphogenesis and NO signaling
VTIATDKTVREVVVENPVASRVFEKLGIDYCCGGSKSLEDACRSANLDLDQVLESLERASQEADATGNRDWNSESLGSLIDHIQRTHHKYTREEVTRLVALFRKVCRVHGENHPELFEVERVFLRLAEELNSHLMKEEIVLFPYVTRLEDALIRNEPVSAPPFGSVQNPISMMEHEHDSAGDALRAIRQATHGYSAPADACFSYQTLYRVLAEFEADLHQHIHLENNVLFPRAIAMEKARSL